MGGNGGTAADNNANRHSPGGRTSTFSTEAGRCGISAVPASKRLNNVKGHLHQRTTFLVTGGLDHDGQMLTLNPPRRFAYLENGHVHLRTGEQFGRVAEHLNHPPPLRVLSQRLEILAAASDTANCPPQTFIPSLTRTARRQRSTQRASATVHKPQK